MQQPEENPAKNMIGGRNGRAWLALLLMVWVAGSIAFYYVMHKPWGGQAGMIFLTLRDLAAALAVLGLAGGVGRSLAGKLFGMTHPMERLALEAVVGFGMVSLAGLVLGMIGLLVPWFAWSILLAGWLLLGRQIFAWLRTWRAALDFSALAGLERLALGFVLLTFGFNLLRSLAPPLKWDSLVYHLEIPQAYLRAGRIFFYPENVYAGFPQVVEVLFAWMMALGRDIAATILGWAVAVVLFLGVEGFSRRLFGDDTGMGPGVRWLAPAILLSGFSISQAMNWAYVDLWVMLFGWAVLVVLDYYRRAGQRQWLVWAGAAAGFAIGAKYTAGVLLPVAAMILLPLWRNKDSGDTSVGQAWKRWVVDMFILGGVAALVALPWLIKNLILVGNPFYPILFNTGPANPWQQVFSGSAQPQRSLLDDLLLPLDATMFSLEGAVIEGKPEYGASLGALLFALIPGLSVGWSQFAHSQRRSLKSLGVAALSAWVIWSVGAHFAEELMRPRHHFGVFGGLAVLATAGYVGLSRSRLQGIRLGRALSALVGLALCLAAIFEVVTIAQADPLPAALGLQSRAEYIQQELGWYGVAIERVNELPDPSQVLFLWEPRTYYCQVTCLLDGKLDNWWYLRQAGGDAAGIARVLRQRGITHVLVYDLGISWVRRTTALSVADWTELDVLRQSQLRLVENIGDTYTLYALDNTP